MFRFTGRRFFGSQGRKDVPKGYAVSNVTPLRKAVGSTMVGAGPLRTALAAASSCPWWGATAVSRPVSRIGWLGLVAPLDPRGHGQLSLDAEVLKAERLALRAPHIQIALLALTLALARARTL